MKVTNLCLLSKSDWAAKYSLKVDGMEYRYQTFNVALMTELFAFPSTKPFHQIRGKVMDMDITNPQKTIENFYKILMLQ